MPGYQNKPAIIFKEDVSSETVPLNAAILAADLSHLISFLTNPNEINYQFVTDLLATHRLFIPSTGLLSALLSRLTACFDDVLFNTAKYDLLSSAEEAEIRFNSAKKILLRTYIVIRSWIINYFVDDWLPNGVLRGMMADYLNLLLDRLRSHDLHSLVDTFFLKIIVEIKKLWLDVCAKYWGLRDLTTLLLEKGYQTFSTLERLVIQFVINLQMGPSGGQNVSHTRLLRALDPRERNKNIVDADSAPSPIVPPEKNLAIVHCSNSVASLGMYLDRSFVIPQKIASRLSPANLFKKDQIPQTRTEKPEVEPVAYNCTIVDPKSSLNTLSFTVYNPSEQGFTKLFQYRVENSKVSLVTTHRALKPQPEQKKTFSGRWKRNTKDHRISRVAEDLVTDKEVVCDVKVDYLSSMVVGELEALMELIQKENQPSDGDESLGLDDTPEIVEASPKDLKLHRMSKSSLKLYLTYNSEASLLIFNQQNLKPRVLEKVKSFEKLTQRKLLAKKATLNLRAPEHADHTRVRSAIHFFQEARTCDRNMSNLTVDTKSRKPSYNPSSIFSDAHNTANTTISSADSIDPAKLENPREIDVIRESPESLRRSPTLDTTNSEALIQSVMKMDSFVDASLHDVSGYMPDEKIEKIDISPLAAGNSSGGDHSLSMLSVASYCVPGVDYEVMKRLADIPDTLFGGKDPVSAALLSLEGDRMGGLPSKRKDEDVILENQVTDLDITDQPQDSPGEKLTFFQPVVFEDVPETIQDALKQGGSLISDFQEKTASFGLSMVGPDHAPFVLEFCAEDVAKTLTVIERDVAFEIDWKELVEFNKDFVSNTDHFYRSWVEILVLRPLQAGIELYLNRFNLVINWVISQILLTKDIYLRTRVIGQFIAVAMRCLNMQNYATMLQIVLALASPKIMLLQKTWAGLDMVSRQNFEILRNFNVDSVENLRDLHNNAVPSRGVIPFVGLYVHDLKLQLIQPNEIAFGKDTLINWSKFHAISRVVHRTITEIQYAKFYKDLCDFDGDDDQKRLLSRCLYIRTLNEQEMDECLQELS